MMFGHFNEKTYFTFYLCKRWCEWMGKHGKMVARHLNGDGHKLRVSPKVERKIAYLFCNLLSHSNYLSYSLSLSFTHTHAISLLHTHTRTLSFPILYRLSIRFVTKSCKFCCKTDLHIYSIFHILLLFSRSKMFFEP